MTILSIIWWLLFGAIIGYVARMLHPGRDELSLMATIGLGCLGSFVGGLINWLGGWSNAMLSSSGFVMSLVGAVICLVIYTNSPQIKAWIANAIDKLGGGS